MKREMEAAQLGLSQETVAYLAPAASLHVPSCLFQTSAALAPLDRTPRGPSAP